MVATLPWLHHPALHAAATTVSAATLRTPSPTTTTGSIITCLLTPVVEKTKNQNADVLTSLWIEYKSDSNGQRLYSKPPPLRMNDTKNPDRQEIAKK